MVLSRVPNYQALVKFIKKAALVVIRILSSRKFFFVIIGLFILQAAWIALFARYPMAFDEDYHFGIIKIYAGQWGPFFSSAPSNSGVFGDIVRDPSYLYHYLMSFPYRFITLFIHQDMIQIIIMRFLNIVIFTGGLFVFRRLLLRLKATLALTHFSLLMLTLIPITPFLAAQMNYDNLIFLLLPISILLTFNCRDAILKKNPLLLKYFLLLLSLGFLTCLVKYVFLPILLGELLYLLVIYIRRPERRAILMSALRGFNVLRLPLKIVIIISVIISSGLFAERYGVNIVKYHNISPNCIQMNSLEECLEYGPWARNYQLAAQVASEHITTNPNPLPFMVDWSYGMMYRLYFAINYNYANLPPLPLPVISAAVVGFVGIILCIIFWRSMFHDHPELLLPIIIIVFYTGALLYVNYTDFLKYDTLVAINGRYFIPLLPLIFILIGQAYRSLFTVVLKQRAMYYKGGLVVITLLFALQGGGALTHLVRSGSDWYWPNQTVIDANLKLKNTISPLIIGTDKSEAE